MENEMSPKDTLISVNPRYKSSTRIDGTEDYKAFVDDFIIHGTAINTLETLCRTFTQSRQRTFTLTGPYGSGKSTLALFLSSLLSQNKDERNYTAEKISKFERLQSLVLELHCEKGWKVIKHVCGLTSPAQSILKNLVLQTKTKINNSEIDSLNDADCLEIIKSIFNKVDKKSNGLVLLLDEMGKALDYQSRIGGDLYFFQELADIAQQSPNNVMIIGFLHQAFVEYAKNKDALTQKEWAKVQGRYVDFGFNPSIDESLVLVGDSITKTKSIAEALQDKFSNLIEVTTRSLRGQSKNRQTLLATMPLDPLVGLLLGPISRRRFSQNERSLFGFLASNEKHAFRDFLITNYGDKENPTLTLYGPELLWDYLDYNLHHVIVTSNDGKGWLEACDAIQRAAQKGGDLHIAITKIIALLTIFGFHSHLHASRELLRDYFVEKEVCAEEFDQALRELESWTVVIFRQKHNALFIFQGSDIDINNLLLETIESISSGVDWTSVCNINMPILATSHYHLTGTMRWANTLVVEKASNIPEGMINDTQATGSAFMTFVLDAKSKSSKELIELSKQKTYAVFAVSKDVGVLKTTAIELLALEYIKKNERQIAHDLIAKNELDTRVDEAKRTLEEQLSLVFGNAQWVYNGDKLKPQSLSSACSEIADIVYSNSPVVLNELVNRAKPSGSANAGINKVMMAMLEHGDEEDLGFDSSSFPPEKGIYLSCLKSKGWHQETKEGFMFPSEWEQEHIDANPDMYKLWQSGITFIKESDALVTMDTLYNFWMRPPFGLTSGLCRIYGLALLKSLDGQVAYYDNDSTNNLIFIPELDEVFVNKLHKHPHEAGVRYFEISNIQSHLIHKIAEATQSNGKDDSSILAIAKHIVKIVHTLPAWVKKTSGDSFVDKSKIGLTEEARAFRNEVLRANDPYKLILESLPTIFKLDITNTDAKELIANKLKTAIYDLTSQHEMLVNGFKQIILEQIGGNFDQDLLRRCINVEKASKRPSVTQFANRLAKFISGAAAFEMVIVTAAGAPEKNWTDRHIRGALDEIHNLCIQFRRIESFSKLSHVKESKPVSLMTKNDEGDDEEYELYLKTGSESDSETISTMREINELISSLSTEKQKVALSRLLIERMKKVQVKQNAD